MIEWLIGLASGYFLIRWLLKNDPEPFLNVYSVPGKWYWFKFQLMKFVIARRHAKNEKEVSKDNLMTSELGGTGRRKIEELERKHEFPKDKPRPADAVFFNASNGDGWNMAVGTAQRANDVINLLFVLRIPEVGVFMAPEMNTDTNVKSISSKSEWKTESGFTIQCVEPMRKWKIHYDGYLVKAAKERIFTEVGAEPACEMELIKTKFDLEWNNFGDHFDFDQECSPISIAHSLAKEKWSRELFQKLKESHQTHYEQFGFLSGNFLIDSKTYEPKPMTSMRDHTIAAYRSWADIRRYIMMVYHLTDGTCIHTSVISMPGVVFTQLEFGYIITPEKKKIAVDRVFFDLAHHGEDKKFPRNFHYSFQAGELFYSVEVKLTETVSFKMGLDQATQVNENMCEFTANGIRGYGFAECEYRISPY